MQISMGNKMANYTFLTITMLMFDITLFMSFPQTELNQTASTFKL